MSDIPLKIIRSARAKRICLRFTPAKDGVIMTLPKRASQEAGMRFFEQKRSWILQHIETPQENHEQPTDIISILGKDYRIENTPGRGVTKFSDCGEKIIVYGMHEFCKRRLNDFLAKYLHEICSQKSTIAAEKIGKEISKIEIKDTKSRWGSCSSQGILTFNRRLIFAPEIIIDYIVAHEVSHLEQMNHSPKFWKIVEQLHPNAKQARIWLKQNGHILHKFD